MEKQKFLLPKDLEVQPYVPSEALLKGHGEPTRGLYKTGKTVNGRQIAWRNVGRFLAKIDKQTREYIPDYVHQGWMLGTGRWISSYHNAAKPTAQKHTWVLHQSNRFSNDRNNEAHLVLLNQKFLMYLYHHSGNNKDFFMAASDGRRTDAIDYMKGILLQNRFLPENNAELGRLHNCLEKHVMAIVLPDEHREHEDLERFQPVSPFVNARVEQDGNFEDGMDEALSEAYKHEAEKASG